MTVSVSSSKSMFIQFSSRVKYDQPMPVATRSKAWVCGRSLAGMVGSNPVGAWMSLSLSVSLMCVVCCQVEASASS